MKVMNKYSNARTMKLWDTITFKRAAWLVFLAEKATRLVMVNGVAVGVPLDRIWIRYCLYHICIYTQPSDTYTDTNTDIDTSECEKMIFVSIKIGYRMSDTDLILADQMRILIGYVKMNMVEEKLNRYTYITFYLIYNNIKCDTYHDIIVHISILLPYPLSFSWITRPPVLNTD